MACGHRGRRRCDRDRGQHRCGYCKRGRSLDCSGLGGNRRRTGGNAGRQASTVHCGYARCGRRPAGRAGQILCRAVAIGASCGELLGMACGDRGRGRCDRNRGQHRCGYRQRGRSLDRSGLSRNRRRTGGNAGRQASTAYRGYARCGGSPGGCAGQVLRRAITIGSGGGKLFGATGCHRCRRRCDCNRGQHRCGYRKRGRSLDRSGLSGNRCRTSGNAGRQASTAHRGYARCG